MCNINSQASRLFSLANPGVGSIVNIQLDHEAINLTDTVSGVNTSTFMGRSNALNQTNVLPLCHFLTAQDADVIDARNSVQYMDLPRYLTTKVESTMSSNPNNFSIKNTRSTTSQNIQLNQIPDYFIITMRKPMVNQKITDSSTFMGISKINFSLNNS